MIHPFTRIVYLAFLSDELERKTLFITNLEKGRLFLLGGARCEEEAVGILLQDFHALDLSITFVH